MTTSTTTELMAAARLGPCTQRRTVRCSGHEMMASAKLHVMAGRYGAASMTDAPISAAVKAASAIRRQPAPVATAGTSGGASERLLSERAVREVFVDICILPSAWRMHF